MPILPRKETVAVFLSLFPFTLERRNWRKRERGRKTLRTENRARDGEDLFRKEGAKLMEKSKEYRKIGVLINVYKKSL